MRKFYLRPLFNLHDPFFPLQRRVQVPTWKIKINNTPSHNEYFETHHKTHDPHEIFQQFFKENQIKLEEEKEFFRKHFPEKIQEKMEAYKVLEISKDATIDQVKDAYRKLSIKYHPKNNSTPEAEAKFAEVSKAYQHIVESKNNRDYGELGFNSFFEDFQKQIDQIHNITKEKVKQSKNEKDSKKPKENQNASKAPKEDFGQLYSESSHYESKNGKNVKYVLEKIYKVDGKLMTVRRQQKLKDDGNVEIIETIDNGKEIKKKTYIHENDVKKVL